MHLDEWQTWGALAVIALTLGIFARAILRSRKNGAGGCAGGCHCTVKEKITPKAPR